jgi:Uncharacterised protein family (UPF0236)
LVTQALRERERNGRLDFEALEMAVRSRLHEMGGHLVERLLDIDQGGYQGPRVGCGEGHEAEFVSYRRKQVVTVLSPVTVHRAYYHCPACRRGVIPKDRTLDIEGTGFSPGVRRMMGRVGSKEPFAEGEEDLKQLAGVAVKTKQVERVAEALGEQAEAMALAERRAILAGKVVALKSVPKLYIAIDGTGVPVVPRETQGRKGKSEKGEAKTREAKVGCVFTQTGSDEQGCPVRDEGSTTYVGAIEEAGTFGWRIYAEAVRRGLSRAARVIVLGDGAPWIWGLADEHFPGAVQIVDLYHAREHLADVGKILYGPCSPESKRWAVARYGQLDAGKVESVMASLRRVRPRDPIARQAVAREISYFQTHAERMRYAQFRRQGFFVGSGVMEAGCKALIGLRLKQSGMRWTVRGANAIIALRCAELSGRWEEFWENRAAANK